MAGSTAHTQNLEDQISELDIKTVQIEGVECVSVADAARLLDISVSVTYRRINSRRSKLETKDWAGVVGVTVASLKKEKAEVSA